VVCRLTDAGPEVVLPVPATGRTPYAGLWMSPDGRFVAVAHSQTDQTWSHVRVWRVDGPAPVVVLDDPDALLRTSLAFRPDSRRMAIAHGQRMVSFYDLESGQCCLRSQLPLSPGLLAYHPRDGRLVFTSGSHIGLFDADTGIAGKQTAFPGASITGLAWHPDGRRLALASEDGFLRVHDTRDGYDRMTTRAGISISGDAINLTFNQTGDLLVVVDPLGQTRLLAANSGRLLLTLPGHSRVTATP